MSTRIKLLFRVFLVPALLISFLFHSVYGDETKWIAVGNLHTWISSAGIEREIGRTGQQADQQDGLRWPAQYRHQDTEAAKAMWIGVKNFYDANVDKTFDTKVVHVGPRVLDDTREVMPQKFIMYGRFDHPGVFVDLTPGSNMMYGMDEVDEIDESLAADRMILNIGHTALGLSWRRKVFAFTNQYHDNYIISEYVFTNTGIINPDGQVSAQTLEDVVIFFQYRYSPTREGGVYGGSWLPQSASWGHNAVNDMIFTHPETGEPFRLQFTWMGKHSQETSFDIIGGPAYDTDGHLAVSQYVGAMTVSASGASNDFTDDPAQPFTTMYLGSDVPITSNNSQFNDAQMTVEYAAMTAGHPSKRHADDIPCINPSDCKSPVDNYVKAGDSGNPGGYSHGQGFGPYTMAPGDSIRLVIAEGVSGISRAMVYEVGGNWLRGASGAPLPDKVGGGAVSFTGKSADADKYKNAWVWTGEDSLIQTMERALDNYNSGFAIPAPPPPPSTFNVNSGGDRIILDWDYAGGTPAGVAGFRLYRAIHAPDTTFDEIFACGAGTENPTLVYEYSDISPTRGFDYYYYIIAFDDGLTNDIAPGTPLVSSKFWTMTSEPASLKRPASSPLNSIRIVPNPYNIAAEALQFSKSDKNRIMFYNIPAYCDIMIYTERGDLIKTLHHIDGSGDEAWDQTTSSRQIIASGLYLAYIEATQDWLDPNTGILVKKGESIIKKFIVIR